MLIFFLYIFIIHTLYFQCRVVSSILKTQSLNYRKKYSFITLFSCAFKRATKYAIDFLILVSCILKVIFPTRYKTSEILCDDAVFSFHHLINNYSMLLYHIISMVVDNQIKKKSTNYIMRP